MPRLLLCTQLRSHRNTILSSEVAVGVHIWRWYFATYQPVVAPASGRPGWAGIDDIELIVLQPEASRCEGADTIIMATNTWFNLKIIDLILNRVLVCSHLVL